jgi:IS605 OrfB family transposase
VKVTRVAFSADLNAGKYAQLEEQARWLGRVRSRVWREYGSVSGAGVSDRAVRDRWMADRTAGGFGVLANAWKETVRDAMGDIRASRESAKVKVRRAVFRRTADPAERKRLFTALKADTWAGDPYLSRMMRKHCRRGRSKAANQIVVRADKYRTFTLTDGGDVWLAVPGLERRQLIKIPLNTTAAPAGTLRLILRDGRVEVHYQVDGSSLKSSLRPHGDRSIGVDKGYTEVLTDSDGEHHGRGLGVLLSAQSDRLKIKNRHRAKIRAVAEKAARRGDRSKADRIARNNLGIVKKTRARRRFEAKVRTVTFEAVHAVTDKAAVIVAEDLTKPFASRRNLGKNTNRRLAAWTKGLTAEALASVPERRGSALVLVNAAYTSQVDPRTGTFGNRRGDRLHCASGDVWQADHAAAINILQRDGDPDITLHTPYTRVKQIVQERTDRHRARLPAQDSSPVSRGGERNILTCSPASNEQEAGTVSTGTSR